MWLRRQGTSFFYGKAFQNRNGSQLIRRKITNIMFNKDVETVANKALASVNTNLSSYVQKKAKALSVFQATIEELTSINNQIAGDLATIGSLLSSLQTSKKDLESEKSANDKTIAKITEVFLV